MRTIKFVAYSLMITSGILLTSCGSDDDGGSEPLPPIGGYNSADEVGADDLLAYFPLNGNGEEVISGTMPSNSSNVSYVEAIKGEGGSFNQGFIAYPSIAALSNTLNDFTISTWAKVTNNGESGSVFFTLSRPNEWAGNINFLAETGWGPATSDSITVKGQIVSNNELAWQDTRNTIKSSPEDIADGHVPFPNKVGGQWMHAVLTWEGSTRMFKVYVNGVKISNPKWEERGTAESPAFMFTTPTLPVIGAFATTANGTATDAWDKGLTGQLDEMRVWKKALNAADINALYELELAGR
ncbi:LamG domain-containing protein [Flavobacterium salilacus subsp. salilacus]|uniref:LamG domain-containing protein n=1 Tax=Flavobacterium TaxID=237 RepID=UPI0010757422|nr:MULTISPECIES: LamG domain-containing protein [Flavobacterium]KAF2519981.1 LamG domain-containing protein [Flavobacterium salilacus subsp. salilacus]MBE1614106.1 LamG domain-containing protein [Flavobacterium sp. SaA2.13]